MEKPLRSPARSKKYWPIIVVLAVVVGLGVILRTDLLGEAGSGSGHSSLLTGSASTLTSDNDPTNDMSPPFTRPTPEADQEPIDLSYGEPVARPDGSFGPAPLVYAGNGPSVVAIDKPQEGPGYLSFTGGLDQHGTIVVYTALTMTESIPVGPGTPTEILIDRPWSDDPAMALVEVKVSGPWTFEVHAVEDAPLITDSEVSGVGMRFMRIQGVSETIHLTTEEQGDGLVFAYDFGDDPQLLCVAGNDTDPADLDFSCEYPDLYLATRISGAWTLTFTGGSHGS